MLWPWSSGKDNRSERDANDPFRDLDPSLRDFLEKESPVKYTSIAPNPTPSVTHTVDVPSPSSTENTDPAIPAKSLYKDGRYAHIWKNYKPLAEIENASKTDQEKLLDVLDGYKERKARIARTALENCALEQYTVNDCFRSGGWRDKMNMCRPQNKKLERCYLMQAKFLKALGYLSTYDRPPEIDEEIQMHADKLFHRMLSQERAIEEAKAGGLPVPEFPPLISKPSIPISSATESEANHGQPFSGSIEALNPTARTKIKDRLGKLTPGERELEEKAISTDIEVADRVGNEVERIREMKRDAKRKRKEDGKETAGDRISSWFGW